MKILMSSNLRNALELVNKVSQQCDHVKSMKEECIHFRELLNIFSPLLKKYQIILDTGINNAATIDDNSDNINDVDGVQIVCEGECEKLAHKRKQWDKRYLQLYSNRLEYGERKRDPTAELLGASLPEFKKKGSFPVNGFTEVKSCEVKRAENARRRSSMFQHRRASQREALVLLLSFQENPGSKRCTKEEFKFTDTAVGSRFLEELTTLIEG